MDTSRSAMAKKPPKQSQEIVGLPIEWTESVSASLFANQMIVQTDEHNCYLSFYEVFPPLIPGGDDEAEQKNTACRSSVRKSEMCCVFERLLLRIRRVSGAAYLTSDFLTSRLMLAKRLRGRNELGN